MQPVPGSAPSVMLLLLLIPMLLMGIVHLVCLVMVIVKMFQQGETGLGIACVVLSFCTGIGVLIAFVYGWVKSSQWELKKVMVIWTAVLAVNLVLTIAAVMAGALTLPTIPVNVGARP